MSSLEYQRTPAAIFYTPSGRVTVSGVILGGVVGLVAAVILAFAYAYIDQYSPIIYVNILVTLGFGYAIGAVVALSMKPLKVRSPVVALTIALISTVLAYYTAWVIWIFSLVQRSNSSIPFSAMGELFFDPRALWGVIERVNETGAWSVGRATSGSNSNVSGLALWVVWLVEAGIIFTMPVFAVRNAFVHPFCESCQNWCKGPTNICRL